MYGPPGTGKTLLARACAAKTNACFLKLAAPQLVQMFIGDGAKLVRDAFTLAAEKAPAIIFIDELDAIGTKRFDSDKSGDREVQRTMLELLNQLDGFTANDQIKVMAATNRPDILDPALLRSGRLGQILSVSVPVFSCIHACRWLYTTELPSTHTVLIFLICVQPQIAKSSSPSRMKTVVPRSFGYTRIR